MSLRHISFSDYKDAAKTRAELEASSYNNLLFATNGKTYFLTDIAGLNEEEAKNSTLKFLGKAGKNYSLHEVYAVVKNKNPELIKRITEKLVINTPLADALKKLSKNLKAEECPIERSMMLFPTLARCGHGFGLVGIQTWLQQQPICPLCKTDLLADSYVRNLALQELNLSVFLSRQAIKAKNPNTLNYLKEELEDFKVRLDDFDKSIQAKKIPPEKLVEIQRKWPQAVNRQTNLLSQKLARNTTKSNLLDLDKAFINLRNKRLALLLALVYGVFLLTSIGSVATPIILGVSVVTVIALAAIGIHTWYKAMHRPNKINSKVDRDTTLLNERERAPQILDQLKLRQEYSAVDRLYKRKNSKPANTAENSIFYNTDKKEVISEVEPLSCSVKSYSTNK